MARQRALYEWILGNGNLWAGQRSLIVGHSGKPIFRRIKERIKNMQKPFTIRRKAGWKQLISILRMKTQLGLMTAKIAMASSQ